MIFVILAFSLGCVNVLSKTINFQATKHLGMANGTLVNYVVASFLSFFLLLMIAPGRLNLSNFTDVPSWYYLGGIFGVLALIINLYALNKINLFQSTGIVLIGQLFGSTFFDGIFFHSMSPMKILGVCLLAIGVLWDKKTAH